jgi:hypothetical protein
LTGCDGREAKPFIRVTITRLELDWLAPRAVLTEESRYADQIEQPRGGGIEMRGELRDLIAEPLEFGVIRMSGQKVGTINVRHDSPCADFNPRFSRPLGAARTRDQTRKPVFSSCDSSRAPRRLYAPLRGR